MPSIRHLSRLLSIAMAAAVSPAAAAGDPGVAASLQPFVDALEAGRGGRAGRGSGQGADPRRPSASPISRPGQPMRPDTVFWIASQSKPITATALMMLVDEGKVRLDDPSRSTCRSSATSGWPSSGTSGMSSCGGRSSGHGPPHPQPHERSAVLLGAGAPDARRPAAPRGGGQLRHDPAPVGAGDEVPVLQRRHQYGGADHRGRRRHPVRGLPREAALRAARHEGYDLPAECRADRSAGEVVQAEGRTARASRRSRSRSSATR